MENTQLTMPCTKSLENSKQIVHMIHQCFAIQNTYSKTPKQLEILMKVMVEDLSPHPIEEINKAFLKWRRTESVVPTPADIIKIILADKPSPYTLDDITNAIQGKTGV